MSRPLIPGLAEELAAAADRVHRRRRRRFQAAAAGSLAVVFVAVMAVTSSVDAPPAGADVQITERDGRVEVRLTDVETRAGVVEDALRDADIDADVVAVPVSPSLVGRFVTASASTGTPGVEPLDGDGATAAGFSFPAGTPGHLELSLGRPAEAGEAYVASGNALSAGEPLACLDLVGRTGRELAEVAAERPAIQFDVLPFDADGRPSAPVGVAEVASGALADWRVAYVQTLALDAVHVRLTPDGQLPPQAPLPPIVGC